MAAYPVSIVRRITFLLPALLFASCSGFEAPRADTLARLQPMRIAARLPSRFEIELRSAGLTGTFDAVFAVEPPGFGLQLFPDIGGKVFDLRVGAGNILAEMPGSRYEATAPLDAASPHLALVLAAVFAELLAPVDGRRALGERALAGGGSEVLLEPALGSGTVVATT
ncbi:MAG: hypothetical protein ABIP94_18005, partial [Planctomycetota bacterium]